MNFVLFVVVIRSCINVVVMATEVCICRDVPTYTAITLSKDEVIDNHMSFLSSFGLSMKNED